MDCERRAEIMLLALDGFERLLLAVDGRVDHKGDVEGIKGF
jgi:hypothetical protein